MKTNEELEAEIEHLKIIIKELTQRISKCESHVRKNTVIGGRQ